MREKPAEATDLRKWAAFNRELVLSFLQNPSCEHIKARINLEIENLTRELSALILGEIGEKEKRGIYKRQGSVTAYKAVLELFDFLKFPAKKEDKE
jgi:hypothetical protein